MELLLRLFTALLFDVLANDFFSAMTSDGTDTRAFRPEFSAPQLFFDCGDVLKHFARGNTLDGPHDFRRTIRGNRLQEKVHMIFLRANLQENNRLAFGNGSTDLFAHEINTGVKYDTAIFRRADQVIHEDGNVVTLMDIFAHTRDDNDFKQAKQASGNLTPRD